MATPPHSVDAIDTKQADDPRLALPDTIVRGQVIWTYAIAISLIHILALAAVIPWLFSWTGLIIMILGIHVFGQGINLCYHRILTHNSAKLPKWLERSFVVIALCCMEDTPAKWVSIHRYHHKHSDEQDDPHSPLVTFIWGHIGWLLIRNKATHNIDTYRQFAGDVLRDPFYMRLEKGFIWVWIYVLHAVLFFLAGFVIGWAVDGTVMAGVQFGLSLFVWGVLVRTVVVWHITWSVNSLSHMFGYSNYKTEDESRNNWLVALMTVGEGWHNNHHHDPSSASNQHRWWEMDVTWWEIRLLEKMGLAKNVKRPKLDHSDHD